MIRFIISLIMLIVVLSVHAGEMQRQDYHRMVAKPNLDVFFANYNDPYDILDAIKSYAITLCVNDKAIGDSAQEWMDAGSKCYDSWSSDTTEDSSNDGGWQAYQHAAYLEINGLCHSTYSGYPICEFFRS